MNRESMVQTAISKIAAMPDDELGTLLELLTSDAPPAVQPAATRKARTRVQKFDEELQIVWSEVYIPDLPDSHGDFMTAEDIRKMGHQFLVDGFQGNIDTQHDNDVSKGNVMVESFIAREDDPLFIPGSWVVGVHVADTETWKAIKNGELNAFSMQAMVFTEPAVLEFDAPPEVVGKTFEEASHTHRYTIRFDDEGNFMGGSTDKVNGHAHKIEHPSVTEEANKHSHRYSFMEHVDAKVVSEG